MLITNDFVMLNFPKTGSTFARDAIKHLYIRRESYVRKFLSRLGFWKPSIMELMMPKIDEANTYGIKDQHGTLRQIPFAHGNKQIVSIMRNPFSRYESTYLFRWWEKYPHADPQKIREKFPNFPKLSFSEYYEMIHDYGRENRLQGIQPRIELGFHTIQFIQFYFRDPESILRKIDDHYIENMQYRKDMGRIYFIHQENLKEELKQFLIDIGIPRDELEFIDSMENINVTSREMVDNRNDNGVIDDSSRKRILEREKLLFTIFPEYLQNNDSAP